MQTIYIALKDLKQILGDWKSFLFLLIMPVAFTLLIGLAFTNAGEDEAMLSLGIIDHTLEHPDTGLLYSLLDMSALFDYEILPPITLDEAKAYINDKTYDAVLIIPEEYSVSLANQDLAVQLVVDENTSVGLSLANELRRIVSRVRSIADGASTAVSLVAMIDPSLVNDTDRQLVLYSDAQSEIQSAWDSPSLSVKATPYYSDASAIETGEYNSYNHASAGIAVQFALAGLTGATALLVEERRKRTLLRMLTAPIQKWQILGGHFLAIFAMVFGQLVILVLFGVLLLKVPYFRAPLATLVMIVAIALFTAAFGMLIGALSRDEDQAVLFSILPMMVLSGLGGAWMPLETTSPAFRTIGHLTPVAWAVDGLKNITERGLGLNATLLPALILVGFGAVCMILAVRFFRTE